MFFHAHFLHLVSFYHYSKPIRKTASTRLSFCSFMASRHINAPKYVPSCKHESHICGHLHGSEQVKYNTFPVRLTAAPENFPPDQPASGFEESDPARD